MKRKTKKVVTFVRGNSKKSRPLLFKARKKTQYLKAMMRQKMAKKISKLGDFFKYRLNASAKLSFFMASTNFLPTEAYKLFSILEMQLSAVLVRAQIVPFFFMVSDLCFYRLVFLNGKIISNPHFIVSLYDTVQLPVFLYQLMNYRQNRFYYYPKHILVLFKMYWGQFVDYTNDKIWMLSTSINSRVTAQILTFSPPNVLLYMSPFRRFSKLYYRPQPERSRGEDSSLMYTHTVFKIKLFSYILYYK